MNNLRTQKVLKLARRNNEQETAWMLMAQSMNV